MTANGTAADDAAVLEEARSGCLTAEAFGRRFRVEGPPSAIASAVSEFPYGWTLSHDQPERVWSVTTHGEQSRALCDARVLATGGEHDSLGRLIGQDIELWVAENADGLVFVHAGVVAVDGYALVLPGRSRAGKSTLVSALVGHGATYFSDEFAVLDGAGHVRPYRRPLKLRPDSPEVLRHAGVRSTDPPPETTAEVALIASLRWDPENRHEIVRVSRAEGVLALLDNCLCATSRPVEALTITSTCASAARCLSGRRPEAHTTALALWEELSRAVSGGRPETPSDPVSPTPAEE